MKTGELETAVVGANFIVVDTSAWSPEGEAGRTKTNIIAIHRRLGDGLGLFRESDKTITSIGILADFLATIRRRRGRYHADSRSGLDGLVGLGELLDIDAAIVEGYLHAGERLGADCLTSILGHEGGRIGVHGSILGKSSGGDCSMQ